MSSTLPVALALLVIAASASPIPSTRSLLGSGGGGGGPYKVASETKPVSGYVCGGLPSAIVYYPTDSTKTYPLISFAHGFTAGGAKVPIDYGPKLLAAVASWGYVIIATEDAPLNYCELETQDQLHSIEVMQGDSRVDWSKPVGIMGHSMGGHATVKSSGNAAAVSKYNIAAAVALHPVPSTIFVQPQVPIFYGTGTADIIVPPLGPIGMYYKTTHAGKVIAEITGATHFEPNTIGPNRWTPYAAAYFGCYLYSLSDACDTIYGSGGSSLCSAVPMTLCKHTPPPSSLNQAEAPVDDHSAPMNELMSSSFIVADMHDGDQKSITMSKIDQAHAKMTIKPYANNQTWIVETILTLSEAAVVGVVDFQVPGKPGPPPCNLTVSLMTEYGGRKGMHGPKKRALEFTDHTGTISKDPKVPLNTWVELTM